MGLDDNAKCVWINLTEDTKDFCYIENVDNEYRFLQKEEMIDEGEDIIKIVKDSYEFDYEKFFIAIQTIKYNTAYFMGFGSYKPIYFRLKSDN